MSTITIPKTRSLSEKDLETISFIQLFREPILGIAALKAGINTKEEAERLGLL